MADETVTITALALDTASADMLTESGNTVEVDATNTAVISDIHPSQRVLVILYENGGGAATATVQAGDRPVAPRAGLGNLAISVPQGDCIAVVLEAARFMQSDGTMQIAITGQHTHVTALRLPVGA